MRFVSLLLALNFVVLAPARAESIVAPDQQLWEAVQDINLRIEVRRNLRGAGGATVVAVLGGVATYVGYNVLDDVGTWIFKSHKAAGVSLAAGTVVAALVTTAAAVAAPVKFVVGTRQDILNFKEGQRAFYRREGNSRVNEALEQISELSSHPVHEQYRIAAADPQLRDFLIRFDAWLRDGVGHNVAPPIQPPWVK